jgi:uncharacterized membrane protein YdjX (TVP38/TMEM64 family)
MEDRGIIVTLILLLIPGTPKSALCYIVGLSKMDIWTFIAISTAGRLVGTILSTVCGHWVRNGNITEFLVLLGSLTILFLLAYIYRNNLIALTRRKD